MTSDGVGFKIPELSRRERNEDMALNNYYHPEVDRIWLRLRMCCGSFDDPGWLYPYGCFCQLGPYSKSLEPVSRPLSFGNPRVSILNVFEVYDTIWLPRMLLVTACRGSLGLPEALFGDSTATKQAAKRQPEKPVACNSGLL